MKGVVLHFWICTCWLCAPDVGYEQLNSHIMQFLITFLSMVFDQVPSVLGSIIYPAWRRGELAELWGGSRPVVCERSKMMELWRWWCMKFCAASYTCKCCEGRMPPAGRIFWNSYTCVWARNYSQLSIKSIQKGCCIWKEQDDGGVKVMSEIVC